MENYERAQVCIDVSKSDLKEAQEELLSIKGKTIALEYLLREAVQEFESRYEEVTE